MPFIVVKMWTIFVSVFTSELDAAITESTVLKTRTIRKRQCLPRYILKLIRKKNA